MFQEVQPKKPPHRKGKRLVKRECYCFVHLTLLLNLHWRIEKILGNNIRDFFSTRLVEMHIIIKHSSIFLQ